MVFHENHLTQVVQKEETNIENMYKNRLHGIQIKQKLYKILFFKKEIISCIVQAKEFHSRNSPTVQTN